MNSYERLDKLIAETEEFYNFIGNSYNNLSEKAKHSKFKKITTYSYDLGIASPSKMGKHIGGYKPGRIIKQIPGNGKYCEFFYDDNEQPLCRKRYNGIGGEDIMFFVNYKGNVWTVSFFKDGTLFKNFDCFKIVKENCKLLGLYKLSAGVMSEEYDYSEENEGIIWCTFSKYIPELWKSSKNIAPGFKNSPIEQWKYKIYINSKGKYVKYELYKNIEGHFEFLNEKQLIK